MPKKVVLAVEKASKKSGFWMSVKRLVSRPRSKMAEVNVGKIARLTTHGDRVVVPGKVLGKGEISHSVTIAALSFSSAALEKLRSAGCKTMSLDEFAEAEPKGSKVRLLA